MRLKLKFLVFVLIGTFFLGGCAPTVTVDGQTYTALTPKEEHELVMIARASLKRSTKIITPQEYQQIANTVPEVKINYYGDRSGKAKVTWELSDHVRTVEFSGPLLTNRMAVHMVTVQKQEGIIDYTQKKPVLRPDPASAEPGGTVGNSSMEELLKSPAR